MKKLCFILGTRPEIIKLSPLIRLCREKRIPFFLLHTNQHYSENMDRLFFSQLNLPKPEYNVNVREKLHGRMVGYMLIEIERILIKETPDIVLVQGDTNTVLAGALAAAKLHIPVGHVEAGLRSYDRTMPEELNRILADHVSAYLFCPTKRQYAILLSEGIEKKKIIVTGNTIVDAVHQNLVLAEKEDACAHYTKERYALLTLHRPSNVDTKAKLSEIMAALEEVSRRIKMPIYFPAHPRTQAMVKKFNIPVDSSCIRVMDPVSYLEMLVMEKHAALILTDSGGLQEEACILRVPCVTIRDNTERPETITVGSNVLGGTTQTGIVKAVGTMIRKNRTWKNPFGDGHASEKILRELMKDSHG